MAASRRGYCCAASFPVPMFNKCLTKTHFPWFGWIRSRWSRIPCPATGNLTGGGGESWRRYAPAWLFRPRRLYGNGIPDGVSIKKARCLSTANFLLTRDSVGIRTQDPQLRRLLLYPAELPNHPAYSAGKKGRAGELDCKYRYFLLFGNVFYAESFFWPQNRYNICRKYGILVI